MLSITYGPIGPLWFGGEITLHKEQKLRGGTTRRLEAFTQVRVAAKLARRFAPARVAVESYYVRTNILGS